MTVIPFVQARHYSPGRTHRIDVLVFHTMENREVAGAARNVADWFAGPSAPQASAHYCVGFPEIVQCVLDSDTAWHAAGSNANSLGFEHVGYAAQTQADWQDAFSRGELDHSAALLAAKCRQYAVPPVWLTAADLRAGRRGICGHATVTAAYPDIAARYGSHTDPGAGFPHDAYILLVKEKLGLVGRTVVAVKAAGRQAQPVRHETQPVPTVARKPTLKSVPKPAAKPAAKPARKRGAGR